MSQVLTPTMIDRLFLRFTASGLKETSGMEGLCSDPNTRDTVVEIWLEELDGLTPEDIGAAWRGYRNRRPAPKFWPSTAELRSCVPRLAIDAQDVADDAFGLFWRLLSSRGATALGSERAQGLLWVRDEDEDRRLKHAAEALGGPGAWRVLKVDDIGMHRASFRAAYRGVTQHELTTGKPKALPDGAGQNVIMFPLAGGGDS
jgi:hypothetical protein